MGCNKSTAAIMLVVALAAVMQPAGASEVTRSLSVNPGITEEVITVNLTATITGGETFYYIEEIIPPGCTVINPGSGVIGIDGHIRWNGGAAGGSYLYQLRLPYLKGVYPFAGIYTFEGMGLSPLIGGQPTVTAINPPMISSPDKSFHIESGESMHTKVRVRNSDITFANITVWLGGDYPGMSKWESLAGATLTGDGRSITIGMNPKEEKDIRLVVYPGPIGAGYNINITANTTADATVDVEDIRISIDQTPTFPGPESWMVLMAVPLACVVFWRIRKP